MAPGTFLRRPHWWLKMIDQYDVTVTAAPNFAYELCNRQVTDAQIAELDLSRWRFAVNGSEPIRSSTLERFAQRFAPAGLRPDVMTPCFGLAEATLIVSGTSGRVPVVRRIDPGLLERHRFAPVAKADSGRELVSCGAPLDLDVRIVDPETLHQLPAGTVGEIWVKGSSIAAGYWRNEEATRATFNARTAEGEAGYLRTGDLGAIHEGELYVTGRLKETIIIHGRNLYPQDVEHELRVRHDALAGLVGAAFAVNVEDPGSLAGEALVVLHEIRGQCDAEEVRELTTQLKETVARVFGVPVADVLLLRPGSIRRTTSGKIQRAAMRELYLTGKLSSL
jgi:acyl-CoA synthetase (AMP-forming)/AMP-acid ligase II